MCAQSNKHPASQQLQPSTSSCGRIMAGLSTSTLFRRPSLASQLHTSCTCIRCMVTDCLGLHAEMQPVARDCKETSSK